MREKEREREGGCGIIFFLYTRHKNFCRQVNRPMAIANEHIPRVSWKVDLRRNQAYSQGTQTKLF